MSYALHPARRVASKKGDRLYHGPKYRVVLSSSISGRSFVTPHPPSTGRSLRPYADWSSMRERRSSDPRDGHARPVGVPRIAEARRQLAFLLGRVATAGE